MKASIVERFNRTIKEKMWRFFSKKNENKYINVLNDFVYSYNRTYHRSIKMRPIDVKKINEERVFFNLYGYFPKKYDLSNREIKLKYKIGDLVRLSNQIENLKKDIHLIGHMNLII